MNLIISYILLLFSMNLENENELLFISRHECVKVHAESYHNAPLGHNFPSVDKDELEF